LGDTTAAIKYCHEDHLGNGSLCSDENGVLVNREEYYPFGGTSFGSYAKKKYRYNGKEKDEESGLYYYGARYYAPWTLRFYSVDPKATETVHQSSYCYADNNPIMFQDINGESTGDEGDKTTDGESEKEKDVSNTDLMHGQSREVDGKNEYWDAKEKEWVNLDHTNSKKVSDFLTKYYDARPSELERFWFNSKSLRKALKDSGGDPVLAYTIYVMEGGGKAISKYGMSFQATKEEDYIDSYAYFGLEFTGNSQSDMVASGVLSETFVNDNKLKLDIGTGNERYENISWYNYPNIESSLKMTSAYVQYASQKIQEFGRNLGYGNPTKNEEIFWTYLYFNSPPEQAGISFIKKGSTAYGSQSQLQEKGGYSLASWTFNDLQNLEANRVNAPLSINIDTMALMRVSTYWYFKIRFNDSARYK